MSSQLGGLMGADAQAHTDAHQYDNNPRHDPAYRQAAIDHLQSQAGSEKAAGRKFDAQADDAQRSAQQARAEATARAAIISKRGPGDPRQRPRSTGVGLHGSGGDLVTRIGSPTDPPIVPGEEESGRPPLHRPRRHHAAVGHAICYFTSTMLAAWGSMYPAFRDNTPGFAGWFQDLGRRHAGGRRVGETFWIPLRSDARPHGVAVDDRRSTEWLRSIGPKCNSDTGLRDRPTAPTKRYETRPSCNLVTFPETSHKPLHTPPSRLLTGLGAERYDNAPSVR
jgi:hypothetical protein